MIKYLVVYKIPSKIICLVGDYMRNEIIYAVNDGGVAEKIVYLMEVGVT